MNNFVFIFLTFVVIVAVILLADNLMTAMLIVSLLANFLVISAQFGKISRSSLDITGRDWGEAPPLDDVLIDEPELPVQDESVPDMYGPYYEKWKAYQPDPPSRPSPTMYSCSERGYNVDTLTTGLGRRRARDKQCLDGRASKDANFYKYHFGGELGEAEDKRWWGRNEW